MMLAGAWLGMALFAVNAWTLRGPHWRRELLLCVATFAGAALLFYAIIWADSAGLLPRVGVKYAALSLVAWKLLLGYWLFISQETSFELYKYFGGKVLNGLPIVIVGALLASRGLAKLVENQVLRIVIS
jgi:hypothetical protein